MVFAEQKAQVGCVKKGVGAKIEYELCVDCEGTVSRTSHNQPYAAERPMRTWVRVTNNFNWLCKQQFMQLFNRQFIIIYGGFIYLYSRFIEPEAKCTVKQYHM